LVYFNNSISLDIRHGGCLFDAYGTPPYASSVPLSSNIRLSDVPMLKQGFNMFIDRTGDHSTNGYEVAHVFGLRGVNCIGYIVQPDGGKMAAVWHSNDGCHRQLKIPQLGSLENSPA
jgi:hypothetical protein